MFPLLFVVLFISQITAASNLSNSAKCWDINYAEKLEEFLNGNKHGTISTQCKYHLLLFAENLKLEKEWAMKMFDAGAKYPPPGMLAGNVADLGNFNECLNIQHRKNNTQVFGKYCFGNTLIDPKKLLTQSTLYPGNSRHTNATTNGTIRIYLARCFPDTCSTIEMQKVYTAIDFELTFPEYLCQTKANQPKFDFGAYAALCFFGIIAYVVIFSTIFDIISCYLLQGRPHQIIFAFSAYTNVGKILEISKHSNDISCVHGIRVLSTIWIILLHRWIFYVASPITNFGYHPNWFTDKKTMLMHSAPIAVDTFFLLSGLFVAYNYMINTLKGVTFNIGLHYLQRYLRITPVLAVLILVTATLLRHLGSGPLWKEYSYGAASSCEKSWLTALLHIQNLVYYKPVCLGYSWYLSTDTQLYILSPFLLISLKKWPNKTFFVIGLIASCSMCAGFAIGWIFELNPVIDANGRDATVMTWYYKYPPYTRATPWLIGLVLGYFLATLKQKKIKFLKSKNTVAILWAFFLLVLFECVFIGHIFVTTKEHTRFLWALHLALVRPIWAVAVSWVIFACANGYGGLINYFLSLPVFQVLSKLSFCMYLVHYLVIRVSFAQITVPPVFSTFEVMQTFWTDLGLTLVGAAALSVSIEMPVLTIYKYLVSRMQKKP